MPKLWLNSFAVAAALLIGPTLRALLSIAAVLALLASSFGPLIDHHFVERQHNHVHIYLGSNEPNHVHAYDAAHIHHPTELLPVEGPSDQTVFLTSTDATGSVGASQIAVSAEVELDISPLGDANSILAFPDGENPLTESFVALPKKPPRA